MDKDELQARARAQHYGPQMLGTIGEAISRIEYEIATARAMNRAEVTALLLDILAPLRELLDEIGEAD